MWFLSDWIERKRRRREEKRLAAQKLFAHGGFITAAQAQAALGMLSIPHSFTHTAAGAMTGRLSTKPISSTPGVNPFQYIPPVVRFSGMEGFSEEGDWDFAAGSVKGYREWHLKFRKSGDAAWAMDDHLVGHWGGAWKGSDWQNAKCGTDGRMINALSMYRGYKELHHELDAVPTEECGCGFWAYWEPEKTATNDSFITPAVSVTGMWIDPNAGEDVITWAKMSIRGIGEGAGRTIIGTKGFRSQKMRVKALYMPHYPLDTLSTVFGGRESSDIIREAREHITQIMPGVPIVEHYANLKEFM